MVCTSVITLCLAATPVVASGHLLPRKNGEDRHDSQVRNVAHAKGAVSFLETPGRHLTASSARSLRWHRIAEKWLQRELSEDWYGSIALVRLYVGDDEAAWLDDCSGSEGGHGGFVWNRQGSGAGGWLQFMRSTWDRMFPHGLQIVRRYGIRVPARARSYFHPLGQAVAGVYGFRFSRGEWVGVGC